MTHAMPPPAIVQQAPPPTLKMIEAISQGIVYFVPANLVCNPQELTLWRGVQVLSRRVTGVVSCDGPSAPIQVPDDPQPLGVKR